MKVLLLQCCTCDYGGSRCGYHRGIWFKYIRYIVFVLLFNGACDREFSFRASLDSGSVWNFLDYMNWQREEAGWKLSL